MKLSRQKPDKKQEKTYTVEQMRKRPGVYIHPETPLDVVITINPNEHGKLVTLITSDRGLILPFEGWKDEGYIELKGETITLEIKT